MTLLLLSGWAAALAALLVALSGVRRARLVGDLAARASHEVRQPLTAAQLALDALATRGEVDAQRTLALDLQLRRARRALDDLVPGARPVPERAEAIPLAALAAEVDAAWRPVAGARGRAFAVEPAPAPAGTVIADRARLSQAVGNLVANALDHGTGPVRVLVGATAGRRARVTVVDAGPGPSRPLPELLAHPPGGAGWSLPPHGHGLRVADAVARGAGGRLVADGAAMTLELPLAEART